jgi:O-antigen ligase
MKNVGMLHKFKIGVLVLASAFPLFMPHQISGIGMLLFLVCAFSAIAESRYVFDWKKMLLISAPFFVFAAAMTQTSHTAEGVEVLQKKLLLLGLPLAFAIRPTLIDEKLRGKLFLVFEVAAFAIGIYANLMMRFRGLTISDPNVTDYAVIYRHALEYYSGLHPTYYAAILFFAAFLSLNNLVRDWKKRHENKMVWVELVLSVLLTTMATASAARAPLFAFGVILFGWALLHFKNIGKTWVAFLLASLFILTLMALPSTRNRILEMTNPANLHAPSGNNDNGTNVRAGIYLCNWETLKQHWLIGVGTGDVQYELNQCLSRFNTHVYSNFNYNTHNEYLNIWFSAGIIGLLVFICSLFLSFKHAIKHKKFTYLFFLVFMSICFFTENYLERQAGIMLYTWFQCLFLFTPKEIHPA